MSNDQFTTFLRINYVFFDGSYLISWKILNCCDSKNLFSLLTFKLQFSIVFQSDKSVYMMKYNISIFPFEISITQQMTKINFITSARLFSYINNNKNIDTRNVLKLICERKMLTKINLNYNKVIIMF